jgi:hypothetical protein
LGPLDPSSPFPATNVKTGNLFRLLIVGPAAFGSHIGPAAAPAANPLAPSTWTVDYSHWADGQPYGRAEAKADWPTLIWFDEPGDGCIREFPAGSGRHWLETVFPAGTFGSGRHGLKFGAALAPHDSYTLEYDVHFPPDFEFSQGNDHPYGGGKLPGLSGGSNPSGGHPAPDGMSARPMWRRDTRFSREPQNYLELYLYWRRQSGKFGDRFFAQTVEAGRTYRLKLRVDLGTPEIDGAARLWIDGVLRVERSCRFRGPDQDWKLTRYLHDEFYGGDDPTWAPLRDQHLLLGAVQIDTRPF